MISLLFTFAFADAFADAPRSGKKIADFAPKGWSIEHSLTADLDGDPLPDVVVVLLQDHDENGDRERALLFLLGTAKGFALKRSNIGLLACLQCSGVKGGDGTPDLEVKNRVLSVSQWGGSREAYGSINRFRLEKDGEVRLIGADHSSVDTLNGDGTLTSDNFLTGKEVIETTKDGEKQSEKKTLPRKPLQRFEDAVEN